MAKAKKVPGVIDGWKYENDWFADRYEPNPYGGEDSVVDV